MSSTVTTLENLQEQIVNCAQCPRLVSWREQVALEKVKRFETETYWGKAVPSFGDFNAQLIITGLAPAAHGANRTGRMFTGDRSGDWLYRALHKVGFANQPESSHSDDGLKLKNAFITAICHCAPPENKPTPIEIKNCTAYLEKEIELLKNAQVFLGLGKIAFDNLWAVLKIKYTIKTTKPVFTHGACVKITNTHWLMGSYHPSQQNTFTGKLTEPMFDGIFEKVNELLAL